MPAHEHRHSDALCAEIAAGQDGAIGLEQLRGAGLTDGAIDRRRRNGRIHLIHRGVYAWGHPSLGPRGYLWAAHLATGGAISHQSAAWAWGLVPPPAMPIHVTVTHHLRSRRGIRVHVSTTLTPAGITTLDGLPVTTVLRTLADLPPRMQPRAVREARFRDLIDLAALPSMTGHPGHARLLRALERDAHAITVRSGNEHDFLDLVDALGLPRPQTNVVVSGHERDFFWPGHQLVVELDGPHHDRGDAPLIDRARDRDLLVRTGIRTVRFSTAELDRADVAQTLQALLVR